jgi:hypothetical protein
MFDPSPEDVGNSSPISAIGCTFSGSTRLPISGGTKFGRFISDQISVFKTLHQDQSLRER